MGDLDFPGVVFVKQMQLVLLLGLSKESKETREDGGG